MENKCNETHISYGWYSYPRIQVDVIFFRSTEWVEIDTYVLHTFKKRTLKSSNQNLSIKIYKCLGNMSHKKKERKGTHKNEKCYGSCRMKNFLPRKNKKYW